MPNRRRNLQSRSRWFRGAAILLLFAAVFAGGCGYHVAGRASHLPSEWKTIAIPAFKNDTNRYRIEQRLTEAVIREFISRTKYRVIQDEKSADAIVHGEVTSIETIPIIFDATSGQVTLDIVTLHSKVQLVDNQTGKAVYKDDDLVFRDEYQISSDVQSFFEEQDPAFGRMCRDYAAKLVSNILEGF